MFSGFGPESDRSVRSSEVNTKFVETKKTVYYKRTHELYTVTLYSDVQLAKTAVQRNEHKERDRFGVR